MEHSTTLRKVKLELEFVVLRLRSLANQCPRYQSLVLLASSALNTRRYRSPALLMLHIFPEVELNFEFVALRFQCLANQRPQYQILVLLASGALDTIPY